MKCAPTAGSPSRFPTHSIPQPPRHCCAEASRSIPRCAIWRPPLVRVGIVGIGGLGHLAIKFARAFGCEVIRFLGLPEKEEKAVARRQPNHFVLSKDPDQMAKAAGTLDFILTTPHTDLNWTAYLNALRPKGRLCVVGAPAHPAQCPPHSAAAEGGDNLRQQYGRAHHHRRDARLCLAASHRRDHRNRADGRSQCRPRQAARRQGTLPSGPESVGSTRTLDNGALAPFFAGRKRLNLPS